MDTLDGGCRGRQLGSLDQSKSTVPVVFCFKVSPQLFEVGARATYYPELHSTPRALATRSYKQPDNPFFVLIQPQG